MAPETKGQHTERYDKIKAEFAHRRAIVSLLGERFKPNNIDGLRLAVGTSKPRLIESLRDGEVEGSRNGLGADRPRSELINEALGLMTHIDKDETVKRLRALADEIETGTVGADVFDALPW